MATVSELITRTRLELADISKTFTHTTTAVGSSVTYDIPRVEQVSTDSVVVRVNGNVIPSTDYILDAQPGIVTLTGTPPQDGDTVQITGQHHKFFPDEVMRTFVETAFELHNTNRQMTWQRLPQTEVYLVALLAKIEALWVLATDAAYDIDIRTPEGVSVPRTQRYAQLMAMIQATTDQYKELAGALGVGLYRIEMFTLRRTSHTTGRLVPIYLPREFDDPRPPQRVYPPIDGQFSKRPEPTSEEVTLQVERGEPFERIFQIFEPDGTTPKDLAGYELEAKIYYSKNLAGEIDTFTVTVLDPAQGTIQLRLTAEQTKGMLENSSYVWNLKVTDASGVDDTPVSGPLLVAGSIPYLRSNTAQHYYP